MSVLVVEDNAEVGKFASRRADRAWLRHHLVGNATHALEELVSDSSRFDVVFSDVVMPGMTGIELAQGNPPPPLRPACGADQRLQPRAVRERQHGFELLQKPYSIEQLSRVAAQGGAAAQAARQAPAAS